MVTFAAGEEPPASKLDTIAASAASYDTLNTGAWSTYSPTWTSSGTAPSLGNGTLNGRYKPVGSRLVIMQLQFIAGSTSTYGTGDWFFSLPVSAASGQDSISVGSAWLFDSGTVIKCGATWITGSTIAVASPTGTVNNVTPHTWATSDSIRIFHTYEPA